MERLRAAMSPAARLPRAFLVARAAAERQRPAARARRPDQAVEVGEQATWQAHAAGAPREQ